VNNCATVVCLQCGAAMRIDRPVARVTHHTSRGRILTDLIRFVCDTPDCGNEVIVEGT
jgi:predicted RNA-binding Zn-ribbon protein involved in translation (DUF1610 family)